MITFVTTIYDQLVKPLKKSLVQLRNHSHILM